MKLADRVIETHSTGIKVASQFNIAQTSKMFKILSDSLYSDKVMAVIRELSTNAYDSHVSAGNRNPFKVTLPTAANPIFSVRDYGTGLSQPDMENLYTTYGASNKNDSNDFVGCLGLGSKSPFAYTKSFTTTSYFDGKQYTYIAAIDDAGVPTLNLVNCIDTNEPNGLEISFAVKQYDFQEFSQKAIRIFHYFNMKPVIHGGVHWDFTKEYSQRNVVIDGDGWRVCRLNNDTIKFPNHHHRIHSGVIALMGNIAYPVEVSHLIGEEKAETPDHIAKWNRAFNKADIASWKAFVGEIINQGLYLELDFGIGDLEMDVSREGLQYTKAVVKSLREKTQDIFVELKKNFTDKIALAKTKIEAITTYYEMNDLAGGWGVGATWTDSSGKVHNINSGEDIEYKLKKDENLYVFNYRTSGYRSRRLVYLTDRIHHDTLTGKGQYYWNNAKKNGKMVFFWCDIAAIETAKKIVTRYCNHNDCFAYLLVNTTDHTDVQNSFADLVKDVGDSNIVNVSDHRDLIKSTPKTRATKNSKGSVSDQEIFLVLGDESDTKPLGYGYNDSSYMRSLSADHLEELIDEDEIVYVPIIRYATADTEKYPEVNNLIKFKDLLNKWKVLNDTNVYAIKKSAVERLQEDGYNLVDFNTWFKKCLKKLSDSKFKEIYQFNDLITRCTTEYNLDDRMGHSYNEGHLDRQFLYHILNMFGLDYAKFVNNKKLVETIDSLMVIEFFADTIHRAEFDIQRFKKDDYYRHMTGLLNDLGINGFDSNKIKDANILYNSMNRMLEQLYSAGSVNEYKKVFKSETNSQYPCPKMADLRKTIKAEVDNNPMLKYIMCVRPVSGNLRELRNVNPLKQLDTNRYYHHNNDDRWFTKLDDSGVDKLRVQLSQTIG